MIGQTAAEATAKPDGQGAWKYNGFFNGLDGSCHVHLCARLYPCRYTSDMANLGDTGPVCRHGDDDDSLLAHIDNDTSYPEARSTGVRFKRHE
jgi:hypothetical protein